MKFVTSRMIGDAATLPGEEAGPVQDTNKRKKQVMRPCTPPLISSTANISVAVPKEKCAWSIQYSYSDNWRCTFSAKMGMYCIKSPESCVPAAAVRVVQLATLAPRFSSNPGPACCTWNSRTTFMNSKNHVFQVNWLLHLMSTNTHCNQWRTRSACYRWQIKRKTTNWFCTYKLHHCTQHVLRISLCTYLKTREGLLIWTGIWFIWDASYCRGSDETTLPLMGAW